MNEGRGAGPGAGAGRSASAGTDAAKGPVRLVRRQGSADPPIHLGERNVEMEMPPMDERRLGQLPPRD